MSPRAEIWVGSTLHGVLVFAGSALLGFVVAPRLGVASGLFAIDAESAAFFSLLTLKGVPFLTALSLGSGLVYPALAARRMPVRALLLVVNALLVWLIAAGAALAILG
jgi:hypothetical protein